MIPIFKTYMPEAIVPEIENILYSGNLSYGKWGKLFEEGLKEYLKNDNVLTLNSYNNAMLMVLSVLDLQPGDEIIASPVSCLASNQSFVIKNIKIIWADVNPVTGSLDPNDVETRITSKTKAIFHNHFCGYLGEIEKMREIASKYNIILVDDCIESFGSEFKGNKIGNKESDIVVFSFQTVRTLNTIDGGAVTFKNRELYEKAVKIRDYGINRLKFRDAMGEISNQCDISLEGYGATMSEINSYIGLEQLKQVDIILDKHRKNASIWQEKLKYREDVIAMPVNKDVNPNYWVFGILCNDKQKTLKEFRNQGWYASSIHINNNIYSIFNNTTELRGVNKFMNKYLAIPCGWWL